MLPPVRNIYCLGRNYAAHAKELGEVAGTRPLVFMKPSTAIVRDGGRVLLPPDSGACHHEVELALLIGKRLRFATREAAEESIVGVACAIDMTLRDLQSELKKKGSPWEPAKCFATSLPLSDFAPRGSLGDLDDIGLELSIDGELRQNGRSSSMILSTGAALAYVSALFLLEPGDVLLTGTPEGVGPVVAGQSIEARIVGGPHIRVTIEDEAV